MGDLVYRCIGVLLGEGIKLNGESGLGLALRVSNGRILLRSIHGFANSSPTFALIYY